MCYFCKAHRFHLKWQQPSIFAESISASLLQYRHTSHLRRIPSSQLRATLPLCDCSVPVSSEGIEEHFVFSSYVDLIEDLIKAGCCLKVTDQVQKMENGKTRWKARALDQDSTYSSFVSCHYKSSISICYWKDVTALLKCTKPNIRIPVCCRFFVFFFHLK